MELPSFPALRIPMPRQDLSLGDVLRVSQLEDPPEILQERSLTGSNGMFAGRRFPFG